LIVTVTVNPAIDRILTVDRLVFEDRAYILSRKEAAGGRGVMSSRVLHCFGAESLAIVTSGGRTGPKLERLLLELGYQVEIYPIQADVRVNLTVTDRNGLTIQLNEPGPELTVEEYAGLTDLVLRRLERADWLMLSGSLPPGVPSTFYASLITQARAHGVKVLLDTDHEPLVEGIESGPTLAVPNQHEAERLLGKALVTRSQFVEAATRIQAMGADWAIVSLGSRGAIGAFGDQLFEATPPRVDAVCPIGAGDALSAAFIWALMRKNDFADALRWGVAAGTASATLPGLNLADLIQTGEIYDQVTVRPVS
jgi:6-phosphofructokinase 2